MASPDFSSRVLTWFDEHGRKDLPWQQAVTPYRVWVSEIMLQQTQVSTVIGYFERFMTRFPTLFDLAQAHQDEVLHLWTGLGYYARGRNLHKAAQIALTQHAAQLPTDIDALMALPGIGRSTAGAILSLGMDQRAVILDGNVKRVLARHQALAGDPAISDVQRKYWAIADAYTPSARAAHYNQAMMDLGATLCTRSRPACTRCPLSASCQALAENDTGAYPQKKRKAKVPERATYMLIYRNELGQVWLQQRPPTGIWGGLWSFPELANSAEEDPLSPTLLRQIEAAAPTLPNVAAVQSLDPLTHVFSHFRLHIQPLLIPVSNSQVAVRESCGQWVTLSPLPALGLPTPVRNLLSQIGEQMNDA